MNNNAPENKDENKKNVLLKIGKFNLSKKIFGL